MLDIQFIRDNAELIKTNSANRLAEVDIDELLRLDSERRVVISQLEALRSRRNKTSKQKPTAEEIEQMKAVGEEVAALEKNLRDVEEPYDRLLLAVPNLTHPDVLVSPDEADNPVLEMVGDIPAFSFPPKDHLELAAALDLIDLDRAAKVAGAKFHYLKDELAWLQIALIHYTLRLITERGYRPLFGPDLAKTKIIERLGFNPRGDSSQVYRIAGEDLSLIGTSEITLGGYHAGETLLLADLPLKYVTYSHCFRTEAGSYSKFSKGIFRLHQFDKVEMFVYCAPKEAEAIHAELLEIQKEIFSGLGLAFQVVDHCTADLGNPAFRTFDLEAWLPGKPNAAGTLGDWGEVTSASNCTDYQARGLGIKYEDPETTERNFASTLNGTGVAVQRALIAIMEQFQRADGSIEVPQVLWPYVPFKTITRA